MQNKRVLIIDDNEQDRKGMAIALKKDGYDEVSFAPADSEGIEIAKILEPDVILIDVVLGHLDGFDICKQIKTVEGLKKTKIIMVTGHLEAVVAKKARISCADEIIEKVAGFKNIGKTIGRLC